MVEHYSCSRFIVRKIKSSRPFTGSIKALVHGEGSLDVDRENHSSLVPVCIPAREITVECSLYSWDPLGVSDKRE